MTAALRRSPAPSNGGSGNGTTFAELLNTEISALWKCVGTWLTVSGGSANAVTANSDTTLAAALTALSAPMLFWFTPSSTNTGAMTLNIDGIGAVSIKDRGGVALGGGELASGKTYPLIYTGSEFRAVTVTSGAAANVSTAPDMIIEEQQTAGTQGGTFTSGAWRQRTLNNKSKRDNIAGSALASNRFTLPTGSYYIEWSAPGYDCGAHQSRLYNFTDSSQVALGENQYGGSMTRSNGCAYVTISAAKDFQIEHQCSTTNNTDGFGVATGFGVTEVYTVVKIWKM